MGCPDMGLEETSANGMTTGRSRTGRGLKTKHEGTTDNDHERWNGFLNLGWVSGKRPICWWLSVIWQGGGGRKGGFILAFLLIDHE